MLLPFYLDSNRFGHIVELPIVQQTYAWLESKKTSGESGCIIGDTWIGKSATAIAFTHKYSSVQKRISTGQVTIIFHYAGANGTYKSTLKHLVDGVAPWVPSIRVKTTGNTAYYELMYLRG